MKRAIITLIVLALVLTSFAQQTIELNNWKFTTGDNAEWAQLRFDDLDWKTIQAGQEWEAQGYEGYDGYAWYRIKFRLPSNLEKTAFFKDSLLFSLGIIDDCDQTFLNGKPLGQNGKIIPAGNTALLPDLSKGELAFNVTRRYTIPVNDPRLLWNQENVLAVKVFDIFGSGGMTSSPLTVGIKDLKEYMPLTISSKPWAPADGGIISKSFSLKNCSPLPEIKGKLTVNVTYADNGKTVSQQNYNIDLKREQATFALNIKGDMYRHMTATSTFTEAKTGCKAVFVQNISPREPGTILAPSDLETPYRLNRLVVSASGVKGNWDYKIDSPFAFQHEGKFYMTYSGFDGSGYQTGLATSTDLVNWKKEGIILRRAPHTPYIQNNAALLWIVRENDVFSSGNLKKINGKFLGVYFANPGEGYESGPGAIGLCWSSDLYNWEVEPPCLTVEGGADWEKGGLYKPCLVEENGKYYLFYNAKNVHPADAPWETGWYEQIGVAVSTDLKHWERFSGNPVVRSGPKGSFDERIVGDPCVLKYRDQWAIFYYCLNDKAVPHNKLALLSSDMQKVVKCDGSLLERGPEGSIDDSFAFKPSIIYHNGVLYQFYAASSGDKYNGISVATSKPVNNK